MILKVLCWIAVAGAVYAGQKGETGLAICGAVLAALVFGVDFVWAARRTAGVPNESEHPRNVRLAMMAVMALLLIVGGMGIRQFLAA